MNEIETYIADIQCDITTQDNLAIVHLYIISEDDIGNESEVTLACARSPKHSPLKLLEHLIYKITTRIEDDMEPFLHDNGGFTKTPHPVDTSKYLVIPGTKRHF